MTLQTQSCFRPMWRGVVGIVGVDILQTSTKMLLLQICKLLQRLGKFHVSLSDPEANTQLLNSTHLSSQGWASSKALFCEQNKINVDHKHAWRVDPWNAVFHVRILVLKSNQDQGQVLSSIPAKLMFWCAFARDTEKIPKKGCSRACAKGPAPTAVSTMGPYPIWICQFSTPTC